jgi:protein-tyrosine phosphatase
MPRRTTMAAATILAAVSLAWLTDPAAAQAKKGSPGQSLGIASVANLRDLGGYATRDGLVVRKGLLYRSNQLSKISPDDMKKIAALGLRCEYDLRTAAERKALPDELPPGVNNIWLDVLADSDQSAPARLGKLMQNPEEANAQLGGGKAEALFVKGYREFVSLPSASKAYRKLFIDLANQDNLPALFHCTTGKDRTGWATAALLSLLGVPEDVIFDDFLRSNDYILPASQKTIDAFTKAGGDPAITQAILGVKAEYLKASFDEMHHRYGTIEDYFSKALEIDARGQDALRARFLTAGAGQKQTENPSTLRSLVVIAGLSLWVQHWKCDPNAATMREKPGLGPKALK